MGFNSAFKGLMQPVTSTRVGWNPIDLSCKHAMQQRTQQESVSHNKSANAHFYY